MTCSYSSPSDVREKGGCHGGCGARPGALVRRKEGWMSGCCMESTGGSLHGGLGPAAASPTEPEGGSPRKGNAPLKSPVVVDSGAKKSVAAAAVVALQSPLDNPGELEKLECMAGENVTGCLSVTAAPATVSAEGCEKGQQAGDTNGADLGKKKMMMGQHSEETAGEQEPTTDNHAAGPAERRRVEGEARQETSVLGNQSVAGGDNLIEEPSGSDQSPPGESQSLDSLESLSNLNSCPSSEFNSEGAEDRAPAPALQNDDYDTRGGEAKASASKERFPGQSVYHIKWIKWKEESTPIVTQNENGPCPLLAIMNVLLLAWKVKLPPMMEIITAEQLMEYLGDYILDAKPKEISEAQRLNYEQNMSDAMAILHKLQTGLDVNVKFIGVRVFEYTPECIVFDLLDIPLYHGWLVDPQSQDIVKAVGNCSYNQLVEKIIFCKQSDNSELVSEGFVAEQFLNSTATQLTYHGLCELTLAVQEGELCVFFRNNHFSTMTKHKGQLYLLVTDQGFLTEEKVVWESLHSVDGDGNFCDSEFHLRPPSDPDTVYRGQQDQIDQDYLMALSLQQEQQSQDLNWEQIPEGISDLELAKKLQEEEDRRASQFYQEQEQAAAAQGQGQQPQSTTSAAATRPPVTNDRKRKEPREKEKDKDKCILL
ncbi:ubiquitin carboxyl-terminal hydrolase MINDY-2 isoform X2 [Latimeria chalumnae]|uniref:ubiquitin carboxyl-terminal hydrolase MINDY-2 isoform X2 n=1 Tax=Latimeria chalumnae TaxID=7897 RepID=UPI0003C19D85|nr:PREDICTED: protein FAM63B isoform X2 [Latimeria chalumnae]|eukprot:XP_005998790.1 PREDICTED: protein FAM63B isoform X2 [Latimeria chalumnae]